MNIIKLNATESTNSYLKEIAVNNSLESYTVVVTEHQTDGRGQLGTTWLSERGKNLTFSVLINFKDFKAEHQFYLSMAVSLGVLSVVNSVVKSNFYIKWPNDILAEKEKVGGILVENRLRGIYIDQSVIGIGLNVNQEQFSLNFGRATSLKKIALIEFDLDDLLYQIVKSIQSFIVYIERNEFNILKKIYLKRLYRFQLPTMFEDNIGLIFLGKIIDVSEDGKLIVELENETTRKFNLKEIKFATS